MFQNRTNNQALMNFWEKLLQKWCHFLCSDNWLSWLGWSIQSHQIYPLFLPDDLDQHIGNKESTRNTQVNLPTSIWIAHNLNSPKYHSILNIFSIIFLQISDREAIALGMRKMLDIATEPWGIKVDLANGIKSPESSPKLSLFHPHASSALNQTFIDNNIFELQSKCQRHIKVNLNI